MPTQVHYGGKTAATGFILNSPSNDIDGLACAGGMDGFLQGALRTEHQVVPLRIDWQDRDSQSCICVNLIQLGGYVEIDQVSGLDLAAARDTVGSFIVNADAGRSREIIG